MIRLLFFLGLILLFQLPQFYAQHLMKIHGNERKNLPGTARQLLEHLKKKFKLDKLNITSTPLMDHFNPETNTVCLTQQKLDSKSITAVAVAAHEFSHALQFAEGSLFLLWRTRLAKLTEFLKKIFSFSLIIGLALVSFQPNITIIFAVLWLISMVMVVFVHLITLPVELDASFKKALPLLQNYLSTQELKDAKDILKACAYTYLAASLASFLTFFLLFRRGRPF